MYFNDERWSLQQVGMESAFVRNKYLTVGRSDVFAMRPIVTQQVTAWEYLRQCATVGEGENFDYCLGINNRHSRFEICLSGRRLDSRSSEPSELNCL